MVGEGLATAAASSLQRQGRGKPRVCQLPGVVPALWHISAPPRHPPLSSSLRFCFFVGDTASPSYFHEWTPCSPVTFLYNMSPTFFSFLGSLSPSRWTSLQFVPITHVLGGGGGEGTRRRFHELQGFVSLDFQHPAALAPSPCCHCILGLGDCPPSGQAFSSHAAWLYRAPCPSVLLPVRL